MGLGLVCGLLALVVLGTITVLGLLVTGHSLDGLYLANPADPSTFTPRPGPLKPTAPAWVAPVVVGLCLLVALAMASLGASRFGHGTVGDGMTGVETITGSGAQPSRQRVVLRLALPVALVSGLSVLVSAERALVVLALLWAPALLPDRRSVFDRLLGLHPTVSVAPKLGRPFGSPEGSR